MRTRISTSLVLLALVALGCGGGGSGGSSGGRGKTGTVTVRDTGVGKILVDGSGRTLYLFEKDTGTRSACSGACAQAWPPVLAHGSLTAGSGAMMRLLGTTKRSDGTREVTYAGHPLYRYAGDMSAGETNGQGSDQFGAEWYVLNGSGRKVEGKPSTSGSMGY